MHEKTKLEASQTEEKLLNEIYYSKKARKELEDEVEARCKDIRQFKRKVEDL